MFLQILVTKTCILFVKEGLKFSFSTKLHGILGHPKYNRTGPGKIIPRKDNRVGGTVPLITQMYFHLHVRVVQ